MQAEVRRSVPGRWVVLAPPLLAMAALAALWAIFDLGSFRSLDQVQESLATLRGEPAAGVYVVGGFAVLTVFFLPVTLLVVATVLTFGSLHGFALAMAGIALAAATTYWAGRFVGSQALLALSGPRMTRATEALKTHAFWASTFARIAPLGNFSVINMLAGSMRIPFWSFLSGSTLGAVPGTLLIALFAEQAREWLLNASPVPLSRLAWLALAGLSLVIVLRIVRRRRAPPP